MASSEIASARRHEALVKSHCAQFRAEAVSLLPQCLNRAPVALRHVWREPGSSGSRRRRLMFYMTAVRMGARRFITFSIREGAASLSECGRVSKHGKSSLITGSGQAPMPPLSRCARVGIALVQRHTNGCPKSRFVIPAEAGIQSFQSILDPGSRLEECRDKLRRGDGLFIGHYLFCGAALRIPGFFAREASA